MERQDKRPKVHAKQKGFKNFFTIDKVNSKIPSTITVIKLNYNLKDSQTKETCLKDQGHLDIRNTSNQKSVGEQAPLPMT